MASTNNPKVPVALPAEVKAALEAAVRRLGTQTRAAEELGVSAAVVNNLLKDRYLGNVATMADRIRGQFMAETVRCPVLGELSKRDCLDNQQRPLVFTNALRSRLFQACKTCPNRRDAS
ncbi:hypothetical protein ACO2Q9_02740 [Variovorax sp. VNK109]|uniref:hypothetical protein n=1 Tax=Variovorax sp. VNK109 TaxID=3400919 RepID=UPI003C021C9F